MTPIQSIDYGDSIADKGELFYEHHNTRIFNCFLQYLRDEAFAALAESVDCKLKGEIGKSDLALGGFDRISQVIVKIKAASEIPPPVSE